MDLIMQNASIERLKSDLESLSQFNSSKGEGITRIVFSEEELKSRFFIKSKMKEIGLDVHEDAIGNIYGILKGTEPELSPVWTGSHIDTVLNGGQFDGTTGVVGGIEALRIIKESGIRHKRNIEVLVYTSEEPTRFGMGCIGSRGLSGDLGLEDTKNLFDKDQNSLYSILQDLDYDLSQFNQIKKEKGDVFACIELHIEQGAVLESLGLKIGVVTTISAPTDIHAEVKGIQGHAGATPMNLRHDAMTAAAKIILELERMAIEAKDPGTVATVGKIKAYPGASNVIPGSVEFTIDIRSAEFTAKERIIERIRQYMSYIGQSYGVTFSTEMLCHDHPMKSDPGIVETIEKVCRDLNIEYNLMVSGAYHDTMMVGRFAKTGMIFIPSKGGISHDKNEWSEYEDIAKGVDVLARTLLILSNLSNM